MFLQHPVQKICDKIRKFRVSPLSSSSGSMVHRQSDFFPSLKFFLAGLLLYPESFSFEMEDLRDTTPFCLGRTSLFKSNYLLNSGIKGRVRVFKVSIIDDIQTGP